MAYLAAQQKVPGKYHPIRRNPQAVAHHHWILDQMSQLGWVSRAAAVAAMHEDLVVQTRPKRAHYADADYFMEEVRERAMAELGDKAQSGGLYIRTTLDSTMQSLARKSLMQGLETYDRRHGWRGPLGHIDLAPGWEKQALAKSPPSERRTWRPAVIDKMSGGRVHVLLPEGGGGGLDAGDVAWARAGKGGLKVGDLVFVEPAGTDRYNLRQVPAVNGALVVIEPHSGRTLALVGGYSFSLSKFNRATQAKRQPGSSFKPFVYATALENGFTPSSEVLDAPVYLNGGGGKVYSPENYEHTYSGMTPLRN